MMPVHRITEDGLRRREQIVQLRRDHIPFMAIGKQFGISAQRAHEIYRDAMDSIPVQAIEEHRAEALELIDTAIAELLPLTRDESISPRTRVEAWSALRMWAERKARHLGTDMPVRVDATVTETSQEDLELIDMVNTAKAQAAAVEAELKAQDDG